MVNLVTLQTDSSEWFCSHWLSNKALNVCPLCWQTAPLFYEVIKTINEFGFVIHEHNTENWESSDSQLSLQTVKHISTNFCWTFWFFLWTDFRTFPTEDIKSFTYDLAPLFFFFFKNIRERHLLGFQSLLCLCGQSCCLFLSKSKTSDYCSTWLNTSGRIWLIIAPINVSRWFTLFIVSIHFLTWNVLFFLPEFLDNSSQDKETLMKTAFSLIK